MMPTGAVNVSMLQLFGRSGADTDDLDIEVQRVVGERVVAVERHHVAHHGRYGEYPQALLRLRLKLHSLADLARALQGSLRDALHQRLVALAVALVRRERHHEGVAVLFPFQGLLQARHEIAVTLDVGEGLAAIGTVEHLAVVAFEGVVDQDYCVRRYLHRRISTLIGYAESLHNYSIGRASRS